MTTDAREAFIRRTLAAAPRLTPERRHRIATVLFGCVGLPEVRRAA